MADASTTCPKCKASLQIPLDTGRMALIRCPVCKQTFNLGSEAKPSTPPAANNLKGKFIGIGIAGLIVFGLIYLISPLFQLAPSYLPQNQTVPKAAAPEPSVAKSYTPPSTPPRRWIHANYRALVDIDDLTQSGDTIKAVIAKGVKSRYDKGQLQPFLEPFSRLLPQMLATAEGGPGEFPRTSILDELPENSTFPAWVALFKGGKIAVTDDGNGVASVFATGSDGQQAYQASYSVVVMRWRRYCRQMANR